MYRTFKLAYQVIGLPSSTSVNTESLTKVREHMIAVSTDLLQGRIQGKSCPLLCSPPPVWHRGGWDTELLEAAGHLR